MQRRRIEPSEQRHHVGDVAWKLVARRVGETIGFAAAGDVGTDHAVAVAERGGEGVEVASLARQPVDTDEHALVVRVAPLPVGEPVQAARAEALDATQARLIVRVAHFICTVPLTVAVTTALPGSTESGPPGPDDAAACIRIIGTTPPPGSPIATLTSRTA